MKSILIATSLALLAACGDRETEAADNTGVNTRDRNGANVTPTDQSGTEADRKLTASVRQALMDDTTLSMNAKNVKVVAQNGTVTLRGPVASQEEKDRIDAKVKALAGVTRVDNQLEVAP